MRKKSTRLLSAALAVCMMLSVLPVGAFAAEPGTEPENGNGVSAQAEETLPFEGKKIIKGGTYTMPEGTYTGNFEINTDDDVKIEITGDVTYEYGFGTQYLFYVTKVGTLTVDGGTHKIRVNTTTDDGAILRVGSSKHVIFEGGHYEQDNIDTMFVLGGTGVADLNHVEAVGPGNVVFNPVFSYMTVNINGGKYIGTGARPTLMCSGGTTYINDVEATNSGGNIAVCVKYAVATVEINKGVYTSNGNVVNVSGATCTINDGTYRVTGPLNCVSNNSADVAATVNIHGGVFEGAGTVISTSGTGTTTIDEKVAKTVIRNIDGEDGGYGKAGVRGDGESKTIISSCMIENAENGIWLRNGTPSVTLKNAEFNNNTNDIYLNANQKITIEDTFTDTATVKCADAVPDRQITTCNTNGQEKLKLTSANSGYVIGYKNDYRGEYRYLTCGYYVDSEKAVATAEINGELNQLDSTKLIAKDTEVTLKAADTAPEGKEFKGWKLYKVVNGTETEITDKTELANLLKNGTETTATLTMPAYNVKAEPYYSDIPYNITAVDCTVDKPEAPMGDTVTATRRKPEANERFTGWTVLVGGEEKEADNFLTQDANDPAKVRFTMPAENVEIKANFEGNPTLNPTLRVGDHVTATIEGSDTPVPSGSAVLKNTIVHLTAIAPDGQHFIGWTVMVGGEEADNFLTPDKNDPTKATFTMPSKNVEVTANFASNPTLNPTLRVGDHVTATIEGSDASVPSGSAVPVGETVHLTATVPDGQHFIGWTVKVGGEEQKADTFLTTPDENDPTKVTFTMPTENVEVKATFAEDPIPEPDPVGPSDTGNIQGAISAVVIGAAAGAIIYEAGTGIYRVINMPGIPMPSNRIELAELLWEHAGKPEPVSTALYSDIDEGDTDAQKAARWAVEQDLMKDDADNNKFHPAFPVSKLRTCLTWNAAKEKGLFDKTEE